MIKALTQNEIKKIIYDNLDNADDNGEFEPDGSLTDLSAESIALDLIEKAVDCEELTPEEMIPHIQTWLDKADEENNDLSDEDGDDRPYEAEED